MTTNPASTVSPPNLAEGQKLAGCYVLKTHLNGPDGAVIWCAQDEVLGKDVSLHFLPTAILRDKIAMNALRQEVKRTRALIHPNILRVYDLVEEADWAAVSMDTFDGRSLATALKEKGKLDPADLVPWLGTLCQTLEEAHKINLIHRDLAPENVFIGGSRGFFLANFGISRVVQDALNRVEKKGSENPRGSTLSPQLLDAQTPARTDDVYGVGTLLFELLAGQPVFAKGDIIQQVRSSVPPRVSEMRGRQDPTVPAVWDEMIASCLHKVAESRPQAPAQIAAKLAGTVPPAAAQRKSSETVPERAVQSQHAEVPVVAVDANAPHAPKKKPAEILAERAAQFKAGETTPAEAPVQSPSEKKPAEILAERAAQFKACEGVNTTDTAPVLPLDEAVPEPPKKKPGEILAERAAQFKAENGASQSATPADKNAKTPDKKADRKVEKPKSSLESGSDLFLSPRQSRSPVGIVAVIALIVVGGAAYYYHLYTKDSAPIHSEIATTDPREGEEFTSVKNALPEPTLTEEPAPAIDRTSASVVSASIAQEPVKVESGIELPAELAVRSPKPVEPAADNPLILVAQNTATKRPAAAAMAPAFAPAVGDTKELAEKTAALERLKQEAAAAEKAHLDKLRQQQAAEAAVMETQKSISDKTKAVAPVKKAVEDLLATRKKREDEQKSAEAAAQAAQLLAAEKAKTAEDAKKALTDFDTQNKEKLAAQQQADMELQAMQQSLADRQKAAADAAKAVADTETTRQQQSAAIKQTELELAQARAAADRAAADAEKKRVATESERRRLDDELTAMRTMFEQKMKEIEDRRRQLESGTPASAPAPIRTEKPPVPPSVEVKPAATPPVVLAMKTEPEKIPIPEAPPETKGSPSENSLGLKFMPVGDVFFSVWQTRVKDFEAFAKAVNLRSNTWKSPGFRQGPDHPVVNVTWNEAVAFCKWLTDKERKEGKLAANQFYRLPSDLEWSAAVGLPPEMGKTPEARDMGVQDVYPWGADWPPPEGAGNYTGEETGSDVAIKGYNDKFPWTAPVGSFPPNRFGLYDMGGNVWQWCMDSWNSDSKAKVLRGASWYNGALKLSLLASCRVHAAPDSSTDNYGFRIVRATDVPGRSARRP